MQQSTKTLPDVAVRWLIESSPALAPEIIPSVLEPQIVAMPIPPEVGHGYLERLPLADGFSLLRGVHRFRPQMDSRLIALAEFDFQFPEVMLAIQTVKGGILRHQERYPPAELIYRPGHDFFRRAERFHVTPWIDTASNSDMTALILTEDVLRELLDPPLAERLIQRLGLDPAPMVRVRPMPLAISGLLQTAMSTQVRGPLRRLFAQAKVLEYLGALMAHVELTEPETRPGGLNRDAIQALHLHLIRLEGKLPSLDELATRFGISARWLNAAFASEYGLPIHRFIAEQRLSEAQRAILESDIPLKQLAARLGYTHTNHFNAAFKRKFGYPPGSLRRKRRGLDDETGSDWV